MTFTYLHPDLVILIGARAILSGIGGVLTMVATWNADRAWDDKEVRTEPDVILEYRSMSSTTMTSADGPPDRLRPQTPFSGPSAPSLYAAGIGWVVLIISFLLDCHEFTGWDVSLVPILAVIFALVLAIVQTILLPAAVQGRCVHEHCYFFAASLLCGWISLGVLMACGSNHSRVWMPIVGSVLIASSPFILWLSRKRGDSYDKGGPANIRPVLYNAAGPVLVAGWLLFWVSMNAVHASPRSFFVPIYFTIRTVIAFLGAGLVVLVHYMAGYAHDEAPQADEDTDEASVEAPAFGLDVPTENSSTHKRSFFFGNANEMKFAFVVAWLVLATAAFLPTFAEGFAQPILLFLVVIAQGIVSALRHERGIRAGDSQQFEKWTLVEVGIFVANAVLFLWEDGVAAGVLAALGAACVLAGEWLLHKDRKRGKYWMATKEVNPDFTVYSYGTLLFPAGMLLLAWGLSMP